MSEIKKLEGEVETGINDAFDKLRADAQKIINDLTFRIKQALHPTNHEPVDAHSNDASAALAAAIDSAHASVRGAEPAPKTAEVTEGAAGGAMAVGASTTDNSGLVAGAATDTKPPQGGEQTDPNAKTDAGEFKLGESA